MSLTNKSLQLDRALRREIAKIADRQVRDLVTAWATAWDEIAPDLNRVLLDMLTTADGKAITRAELIRSTRLKNALTVIAVKLDDLARQANITITGSLRDTIDKAGAAQASIIDSQLPPNSGHLVDLDVWSRVDPLQVDAIVKRSTQQITSRTRPLSVQATAAVRRELVRGIAAGSPPRETARRIVRRAEGKFNGGLNRAMTIARTETLDAYRAAAQVGQEQHADVLKGWVWSTNLSKRTCPACLGMHGTEHPLSEPGPLGHPQCRCTRVPVVKSWAELGFDGIDEPDSTLPDADTFFAGLAREDQERILGKRGWVAWNASEFPRETWAVRRSSKGWRDSYVPAKPPGAGGGRGNGPGPLLAWPGDRPLPLITDEHLTKVMEGRFTPAGKWVGGHRHGRGIEGKTEFPPSWDSERVRSATTEAMRAAHWREVFGDRTVARREIAGVIVEVSWYYDATGVPVFRASFPRNGDGVVRNTDGQQVDVPLDRTFLRP